MLRFLLRHPQLQKLATQHIDPTKTLQQVSHSCGCLIQVRGVRSHLISVPTDKAKYQAFTPTDSQQKHKKQTQKDKASDTDKNPQLKTRPKEVGEALVGLNVIVVDNLPKDTSLSSITEVLETFGKVVECSLMVENDSITVNARMETRGSCEKVLSWFADADKTFPGIEGRRVGCHLKFSPGH